MVKKLIKYEDKLPLCFSMISVATKLAEALACYFSGLIREKTGAFTQVNLFFSVIEIISLLSIIAIISI
jgi:ACR3 family arsenite efflux pump ArsB